MTTTPSRKMSAEIRYCDRRSADLATAMLTVKGYEVEPIVWANPDRTSSSVWIMASIDTELERGAFQRMVERLVAPAGVVVLAGEYNQHLAIDYITAAILRSPGFRCNGAQQLELFWQELETLTPQLIRALQQLAIATRLNQEVGE
jgi:hypothetical protein